MAMSMMDYLNAQLNLCSDPNMTQERFGEIMHDDNLTDDQKKEYLQKVATYGGYANLVKKEDK